MTILTHHHGAVAKLVHYLSLLCRDPVELDDRLCARVQIKTQGDSCAYLYPTECWHDAVERLASTLGGELHSILSEVTLSQIESAVLSRIDKLPTDRPFALFFNSILSLARFCYVACRLLKPTTVAETGVCYGAASAFLLQALEVNGKGHLYSIDLPPLHRNPHQWVGVLVPPSLRSRWVVKLGTSKRHLPALLREVGPVDMFFHDSLHTYSNMSLEFRLVEQYLSSLSLVVADDIDGNAAFRDWTARTRPNIVSCIQESDKQSLFGFAVNLTDGAREVSAGGVSLQSGQTSTRPVIQL